MKTWTFKKSGVPLSVGGPIKRSAFPDAGFEVFIFPCIAVKPARCKKIMLRNRAGLLGGTGSSSPKRVTDFSKYYSGTFQRFGTLQFIPIQEFTFSDIVG
ncbi:MAG: hypothetical protein A2162_12115 [Deltaproteobacteria bacterium RBG_13_52_11b]|nr:MAG: hypothetical protein A2162_12115 [Deltaproteobacteria bacterium RBG_13_52_11b]